MNPKLHSIQLQAEERVEELRSCWGKQGASITLGFMVQDGLCCVFWLSDGYVKFCLSLMHAEMKEGKASITEGEQSKPEKKMTQNMKAP